MASIQDLRKRLPVPAFVLLLVLLLLVLGFACLCMTDHPTQAAERALAAVAHAPAVLTIWAFGLVVATLAVGVPVEPVFGIGRASPARLQRFLF